MMSKSIRVLEASEDGDSWGERRDRGTTGSVRGVLTCNGISEYINYNTTIPWHHENTHHTICDIPIIRSFIMPQRDYWKLGVRCGFPLFGHQGWWCSLVILCLHSTLIPCAGSGVMGSVSQIRVVRHTTVAEAARVLGGDGLGASPDALAMVERRDLTVTFSCSVCKTFSICGTKRKKWDGWEGSS